MYYNVTIEYHEKDNRFQVTWHDPGNNSQDCFSQAAAITLDEAQKLWQKPECQLDIGEKLFRFLDGDARHFLRALDQANHRGEFLQIYLRTCSQTADWPFELLAKDNTFLLPHRLNLVRRVSEWGAGSKPSPQKRHLKLLFMACSAVDIKQELDFELEEEAIYRTTEKLSMEMDVEDSGSLEGLCARLEQEQYDIVHLSGHADIDKEGTPFFVMEDETGKRRDVSPLDLWQEALIENPPRLLFLSGCRTGETPDNPGSPGGTEAVSFARLLVKDHHVPTVLGWGRSVADKQAILATRMLFKELSRGKTILQAMQRARYELHDDFPTRDPAWPLLRLFSGGTALNAIVEKGLPRRPKPRRMQYVYLKNSRIRMPAHGFVGRRRQMQTGLRALEQDYDKVGVLVLGTAGLGKSCLAGKICERFPGHTLIIVQGKLDSITLEAALKDAFIISQDQEGQEILAQKTGTGETTQPDKSFCGGAGGGILEKSPLLAEGNSLTHKLSRLCATSFKEKNYLLLLDGFDCNLEGADKGQPGPLLPEAADLLKTLLHYLPFSGKMTQMIITSRFMFSLTEQGQNLVRERLENVWLTGFRESEQRKKALGLENISNYKEHVLISHLLSAGRGNPRLMEWIDMEVGRMASAEVAQLKQSVKDKQEEFIREHMIRELLLFGGKELEVFLRWLGLYHAPVSMDGVKLAAENAGVENWQELLRRGVDLGLIEYDRARQSYRVTSLLGKELSQEIEAPVEFYQTAVGYYRGIKVNEKRKSIAPGQAEEWPALP